MKKCGLLGENIQYSSSPSIHNDYYLKKGVKLTYEIFDTSHSGLSHFIKGLSEEQIIGFNVTIPYKESIIKYLDELAYPADRINAVNTVLVKDKTLVGFNTDYFGFIKSLEEYNLNLEGKHALVIGNGGAAKCIAVALQDLKCKSIDIAARDITRSYDYFNRFCNIRELKEVNEFTKYSIIVNCTPLGGVHYRNISPVAINQLSKDCIVYDLVYNPKLTRFLEEAREYGALIINGESMLKYQAYKAADIWLSYNNMI